MTVAIKYPVDLTGVNPNNLITGETHNLLQLGARIFKPVYGTFYELGLIVFNATTGLVLTPRVDYVVAQLDPTATGRSGGRACYQLIIIKNPDIAEVTLQYQAVGGDYNISAAALMEYVGNLENDNRPITWGMLVGTPTEFPSAPHQTSGWELYNMGDLIFAINRLADKIREGDLNELEDVYAYLEQEIGKVNYPVASTTEAVNGTDNVKRMTSLRVKEAIVNALNNYVPSNQSDVWDYSVGAGVIDGEWGYLRNKNNGLTLCWGTTDPMAIGVIRKINYRRRFDSLPVLLTSDVQSVASNANWGGIHSEIPVHATTTASFHTRVSRFSGTGDGYVQVNYLAIGISAANQPLATVRSENTLLPPTYAERLQPTWITGGIANTTAIDETKYMGLIFSSSVQGGGILNNATTVGNLFGNATFHYTQYPDYFNDADYEVKITVIDGIHTLPGDFTYIGRPLNTWVDLSVMKGLDPSDPDAMFMWAITGQYSGSIGLSLTIRHKAFPEKIASTNITLTHAPSVLPSLINGNANAEYTSTFNIPANTSDTFSLKVVSGGIDLLKDGATYQHFTFSASRPLDEYEARWVYATEMEALVNPVDGFMTNPGSATPNEWFSLDVFLDVMVDVTSSYTHVVNKRFIDYQVRHKVDTNATSNLRLRINRPATSTAPIFRALPGGQIVTNMLTYDAAGDLGADNGGRIEVALNNDGNLIVTLTNGRAPELDIVERVTEFSWADVGLGWKSEYYKANIRVLQITDYGSGKFALSPTSAPLDTWFDVDMMPEYMWEIFSDDPKGAITLGINVKEKFTNVETGLMLQLRFLDNAYYDNN